MVRPVNGHIMLSATQFSLNMYMRFELTLDFCTLHNAKTQHYKLKLKFF